MYVKKVHWNIYKNHYINAILLVNPGCYQQILPNYQCPLMKKDSEKFFSVCASVLWNSLPVNL